MTRDEFVQRFPEFLFGEIFDEAVAGRSVQRMDGIRGDGDRVCAMWNGSAEAVSWESTTAPTEEDLRVALNSLLGAQFDAEHPGAWRHTFFWDAEAKAGKRVLTDAQKAIIARRKELTA